MVYFEDSERRQRKIPAYRIMQVRRMRKLKDMTNKVWPKVYRHESESDDDERGKSHTKASLLRIILSLKNKYHVSTITGYNPVRDKILEPNLSKKSLDRLKVAIEKRRVLDEIHLPSIREDKLLQDVLCEMKSSRTSGFESTNRVYVAGNSKYVTNEMDLQKMDLSSYEGTVCQIIKNAERESNSAESHQTEFYSEMNSLHGHQFKDIREESQRFDLLSMLEDTQANLSGYTQVEEDDTFEGLKYADFAKIRNFDPSKSV
ncbi:hypothetical protein FOA43_004178 [Brettanomyces nanus]|uniref:Uncharacterized protein n=1 Tax=Eeniella nana TaxID=13502 RepID=A0A875SDL7_EENNA|nr:uncharacterized protein FOA43_004178 [Brettanomyces nanus]QPG76784.1 hypothetical protein FOA43_004178 [Brettanomyces nanus]